MDASSVNTQDLLSGDIKVRYVGDNRDGLRGLIGTPWKVGNGAVGVKYPHAGDNAWQTYADGPLGLVWAAEWAWEVVEPEPVVEPDPYDGPHGKALKAIDDELTRLRIRSTELVAARKVIENL